MDLKAIQAALLFGGQSGPGGDWAEAVCAPFTASGGTVVCSPLAGRALTVAAAGATTQAGGGTAAPGNIRALGGVGKNGSLTLTAAGGETREVEIPLTGPLYTGDMVALAADGSVTETHRAIKLTVDGSENWISWTNPRDTADITVPGTIGSLGDILCSHYSPLAGTLSSDAGLYTVSTNTTAEPGKTRIILRHGFKTLALFKEYLKAQADAGTPVTFVYKLTPATETPTVTKRTAEPLCAVPDADGLCTVQGGGTLTVRIPAPPAVPWKSALPLWRRRREADRYFCGPHPGGVPLWPLRLDPGRRQNLARRAGPGGTGRHHRADALL